MIQETTDGNKFGHIYNMGVFTSYEMRKGVRKSKRINFKESIPENSLLRIFI